MTLELIQEHTFITELLTPGSFVLDVGCRGFVIPRELASRGCHVVAMDPDPAVVDPGIDGVTFLRRALVARGKPAALQYAAFGNGTSNFVLRDPQHRTPHGASVLTVECLDINAVSRAFAVDVWSAVKLDCEGAEYDILLDWPGPIAKQICVEFHEHTHYNRDKNYYPKMLEHLGQWYDVVRHDSGLQHGIPELNYWDSVFALR